MDDIGAVIGSCLVAFFTFLLGIVSGLNICDNDLTKVEKNYCITTYEKYTDVQKCIERAGNYTLEEFIQDIRNTQDEQNRSL